MALLKRYDSFFSSYARKPPKGYSGTAIFTKKSACIPLKAEEGISGIIQADNAKTIPISQNVGAYPAPSVVSALDIESSELRDLDIEGRTTIIDLGLFVLINLYCPNQTNDERLIFKMAFNAMVEARVSALVKAGRQVMVVGDMNISSQEIDHCEPNKQGSDFGDTPPRKWFNKWIGADGQMVDVCRRMHPMRKFMYTCWETRINARDSNYGARIDYILVTPGLLPWVKACDIQPDVKGSDHCPVYIDLRDSILDENGITLNLWELVNPPERLRDGPAPDPPLFSARFYPEHAQSLLSTFFVKKCALPTQAVKMQVPAASPEEELSVDAALARLHSQPDPISKTPPSTTPVLPARVQSLSQPVASSSRLSSPILNTASSSNSGPILLDDDDDEDLEIAASAPPKNKTQSNFSSSKNKGKEKEKEKAKEKEKPKGPLDQKSVKDFFAPPPKPKPKTKDGGKQKKRAVSGDAEQPKAKKAKSEDVEQNAAHSPIPASSKIASDCPSSKGDSKAFHFDAESMAEANAASAGAWSDLFKKSKKEVVLCQMHNEPCKEWEVNKPGVNKGRKFWLCARPVGEGHGKSKYTEFRCDHFEWSTNVVRPYLVSKNKR